MSAPTEGYRVNLCYSDESGTGSEPVAVMVGVMVDASRMHLTKAHWQDLLDYLSKLAGRQIVELHTRDFHSGNGVWRGIKGPQRSTIMSLIFQWLKVRKHRIVYASVLKKSYHDAHAAGDIPSELNTLWRFMGFHLILASQKLGMCESGVKGHTLFVFDNEERERMRFTDLIARPPAWSDEYYGRKKKQDQLDQIVDVPYFGDSREVALIQVADFLAFLLRRYATLKEGLSVPDYADEEQKVTAWINAFTERAIDRRFIYPRSPRDYAVEIFYRHAPSSLRDLRVT